MLSLPTSLSTPGKNALSPPTHTPPSPNTQTLLNEFYLDRTQETHLPFCGDDHPDKPPSIQFNSRVNLPFVSQLDGKVDQNKLPVLANRNRQIRHSHELGPVFFQACAFIPLYEPFVDLAGRSDLLLR